MLPDRAAVLWLKTVFCIITLLFTNIATASRLVEIRSKLELVTTTFNPEKVSTAFTRADGACNSVTPAHRNTAAQ